MLTSSSEKLRSHFRDPIHHLLLTVVHTRGNISPTIQAIRLDFLEPTTTVNVRLEASVNHKILTHDSHQSRVI